MPYSKTLPSTMCPSCKFYEFRKNSGNPHNCKHAGNFTNSTKIGHDPDKSGTCRVFQPK